MATDRHLFFLLRRFDDFFSPEFFFFSSPFLSVLRAYLEVSNVTEARQVIRMANYLWQRAAEGSQADGRREERGREGSGWSRRRGREERRKHDKTTGLLLPRPPEEEEARLPCMFFHCVSSSSHSSSSLIFRRAAEQKGEKKMKISGRCTRDDRRPKDFVPGRPAEPSKKGPSLTQLNDASSLFYPKK